MEGYFELEQKKYPEASISFFVHDIPPEIQLPPMLILPLIENSFKHGRHKIENNSMVSAELTVKNHKLEFQIKNDKMAITSFPSKTLHGGIGLVNIKKRMELYYPERHELLLTETEQSYNAKLIINL